MPKSVLVADDSLTIRKVVGMLFATEDLQLTTVDNGLDAVARARELRPDLVLADCMMPGKTGYEVCQELKGDPSTAHIPVLLLAGNFEPFDPARAQAVGANGHIAKPFDSTSFLDRVRQSVGLSGAAAMPNTMPSAQPTSQNPAFVPGAQASAPPAPVQNRPAVPQQPLQGMQPPRPMPGAAGMPPRPGGIPPGTQPGYRSPMAPPAGAPPGYRPPMPGQPPPQGQYAPRPPMQGHPGAPPPQGYPQRPMGVPGMPGTMPPQPGMARPPMPGTPGMPPAPGMPGGFPRPPGAAPLPGAGMPPRRDPFGLPQPAARQPPPPQHAPQRHESLELDSDGGEAVLRDALSKASKEVIEKIAWEVVPQLAETIIRQELDRLVKDREAKGLA